MSEKDTEQLENELSAADDVEKFLDENADNFRDFTFAEYLKRLLKSKNLSRKEVVEASWIDFGYAPHIFSGRNVPTREKVLMLALAMKLSPKEADYLLYYAGREKLYARNPHDAIIIFALERGKTVLETNELLRKADMTILPIKDAE